MRKELAKLKEVWYDTSCIDWLYWQRYRRGHNGIDSKSCYLCLKPNNYTMETYRSGHNEPDSKTSDHFGTVFLKTLDFSRLWRYHQGKKFCSSLHQFSPFSGVLFEGWCCEKYTQRYRSGHNGADSKSVWEQSHEGSNPSRCAKKVQSTSGFMPFVGFSFCFLRDSDWKFMCQFSPKAA